MKSQIGKWAGWSAGNPESNFLCLTPICQSNFLCLTPIGESNFLCLTRRLAGWLGTQSPRNCPSTKKSLKKNTSTFLTSKNYLDKTTSKNTSKNMYVLVFMIWIDRSREMLSNGVNIVSNGTKFTSFWPLQSFEHFQLELSQNKTTL